MRGIGKKETNIKEEELISPWLVRFLGLTEVILTIIGILFIFCLFFPVFNQTTVYVTLDNQLLISNLYAETGKVTPFVWLESKQDNKTTSLYAINIIVANRSSSINFPHSTKMINLKRKVVGEHKIKVDIGNLTEYKIVVTSIAEGKIVGSRIIEVNYEASRIDI